jgi:hypothetical protein
MNVYNALDLKKGKKTEYNKMGSLMQPVQFLPSSEKDDEWRAWNLDWLEWQGVRQLRRNAVRLLKNYKLVHSSKCILTNDFFSSIIFDLPIN